MAQSESFENLEEQYLFLDRNFNRLFAACTTDDQKNQLRRAYVNARDNFWEARLRIFMENDPLVEELNSQLKAAKERIEDMLGNLKQIVQVLNTITAAVQLGSSLITLGSSALA